MTPCPTLDQFTSFLDGRLAEAEQKALVGHVEDCPACQQTLERMMAPAQGLPPTSESLPAPLQEFLWRLQACSPTNASRGYPVVAGYEVLAELGRGGMGVVYKARDVALKRLVALKVLLAGPHAGPEELTRFCTETEAAARLQHPGIVQIYEVGEHAGLPYSALEYVKGGTLAQWLAVGRLPIPTAAHLVEQMARAMHYAHQRGVIHRDLKPANVLLADAESLADGSGLCKITDFGLAKHLDANGPTQTGQIMGTPSYMAPEQARGFTHQIGPATDIHALGAILYECLTGRPPFRAASAWDTVAQVIANDPVPPSRHEPNTPRDLETICLK